MRRVSLCAVGALFRGGGELAERAVAGVPSGEPALDLHGHAGVLAEPVPESRQCGAEAGDHGRLGVGCRSGEGGGWSSKAPMSRRAKPSPLPSATRELPSRSRPCGNVRLAPVDQRRVRPQPVVASGGVDEAGVADVGHVRLVDVGARAEVEVVARVIIRERGRDPRRAPARRVGVDLIRAAAQDRVLQHELGVLGWGAGGCRSGSADVRGVRSNHGHPVGGELRVPVKARSCLQPGARKPRDVDEAVANGRLAAVCLDAEVSAGHARALDRRRSPRRSRQSWP